MEENIRKWYVLYYVDPIRGAKGARQSFRNFLAREALPLEMFSPVYVRREEVDGKTVFRETALTYYYVFVKGGLTDVKKLCQSASNGFAFLVNPTASTSRYATIDDGRMLEFKRIASAYENRMPVVSMTNDALISGDTVEIVGGEHAGLQGVFLPHPKSRRGNVLKSLFGNLYLELTNISATDVRVISFAKNGTRSYDQIDAALPRLFAALRHHKAGEALPQALHEQLQIFCSRLGQVNINNKKTMAKLQAYLSVASALLGDALSAQIYRRNYIALEGHITNAWTAAAIALLFAVIDHEQISPAELVPTTATQRAIYNEYEYHSQT